MCKEKSVIVAADALAHHEAVDWDGDDESDGQAERQAPPKDNIVQFGVDGAGDEPFGNVVDDSH